MIKILSAEESREVALNTVKEVAGLIKQTLGPGGLAIPIQQSGREADGSPKQPVITKDGVTVAKAISFKDPAKDTIAQAIIQSAKKTVNEAGDGTTTSILLTEALYESGYQLLKLGRGQNGIQLYNELNDIKDNIINLLQDMSKEVSEEDLLNVARVSCNGDEHIANIVKDAVLNVGEDGHVAIEESPGRETYLKFIEGASYKRGWTSFGAFGQNFVNNEAKNVCEMSNPAVLLYSGKLDSVDELGQFVNKLMEADRDGRITNPVPLFIIAHDYTDDVKSFITRMRVQFNLNVAAIYSPFDGSPNARTGMMHDLASLLEAKVFAPGILELKEMKSTYLGSAEKLEIGPQHTTFFHGEGDVKAIEARINDLKTQLETQNLHEFDAGNLRYRIGKLSGGLAVVYVGGSSEIEIKEKRDRVEDALCAARVAAKEGILPGGGISLYRIAEGMEETSLAKKIMKEALQKPIRQIILNVGENPDVVLSHLPDQKGYNALTKEYGNLMEEGIVDPLKVTKAALESAVSIAGLLLTTGGSIVSDNSSNGDGVPNPLAALGLG